MSRSETTTNDGIKLECTCDWTFEADNESHAYKRRKSHEDLCDGEVTHPDN